MIIIAVSEYFRISWNNANPSIIAITTPRVLQALKNAVQRRTHDPPDHHLNLFREFRNYLLEAQRIPVSMYVCTSNARLCIQYDVRRSKEARSFLTHVVFVFRIKIICRRSSPSRFTGCKQCDNVVHVDATSNDLTSNPHFRYQRSLAKALI